ncbi:hypothetical protein [Streptomyces sp. bgisy153]|uniref:hypothetical protein n=1 Tax=Streptomyces sp. bgisy153 TaxID=3413793 RepID=UPI003D765CAA
MRLQILELPPEREGGTVCTPFLLVLSETAGVGEDELGSLTDQLQQAAQRAGARGALVFEHEVEVT